MCRGLISFLLAVLAIPGCFPYAVPPMRLAVGPTVRQGDLGDDAGDTSNSSMVSFRGGIHPIGALHHGAEQPFDVGLGYGVEGSSGHENANGTNPTAIHGPYLEFSALPLRRPLIGERLGLRLGATTAIDYLFRDNTTDAGVGLSAGPLLELTGAANGPFVSVSGPGDFSVGQASGYWAVGLFGNVTMRKFDDQYSQAYSAGISVRVPFAYGIACCALPHGHH